MRKRYHTIIIGTGQAGAPLTGRLNEAGMKTVVQARAND